eukprot:778257-Rhodomonas_salina.1
MPLKRAKTVKFFFTPRWPTLLFHSCQHSRVCVGQYSASYEDSTTLEYRGVHRSVQHLSTEVCIGQYNTEYGLCVGDGRSTLRFVLSVRRTVQHLSTEVCIEQYITEYG